MDIRNPRPMVAFARERLEHAQNKEKIALIFAAVAVVVPGLVTVINYLLGLQIDKTGGLSNMSLRSVLSTVQTMLPMVSSMFLLCLELGLHSSMLRIARGQYASPNGLRLGFDRFWVLLRATLMQGLTYLGAGFAATYFGIMIFLSTPLSNATQEVLAPVLAQTSLLNSAIVLDDATYNAAVATMTPAFILCGIACLALIGPLYYNYRMVNYVLIDKPGLGAMAALRESKRMMRRNRIALLKLDIRLWWYYLASLAATVLCYGDAIAFKLGISLPLGEEAAYFLFFALYLIAQGAIYYFLFPTASATYALAYDSLRPKEPENSGVVLGNIFQM